MLLCFVFDVLQSSVLSNTSQKKSFEKEGFADNFKICQSNGRYLLWKNKGNGTANRKDVIHILNNFIHVLDGATSQS